MATARIPLLPEAEAYRPALETLLTGAVRDAEDTLTRTRDIGSWLREEALLAAMRIGQEADIQAGADALSDLLAKARARYHVLDEAIGSITKQHARLGVHLDPLNPDHSHLKITFKNGQHYDAFRAVEPPDRKTVMNMLGSLIALMPETPPFAGHPHVQTALVVSGDAALKLTAERTATGRHARETFKVEAPSFQPLRLSSREHACEAILQYFGYAGHSGDPATQ